MEKRFGDAIELLEQALKLDPTSSELAAELETCDRKKPGMSGRKCLRRVEDARERQDFEGAQKEIARAIELDKDDSRVRAALRRAGSADRRGARVVQDQETS